LASSLFCAALGATLALACKPRAEPAAADQRTALPLPAEPAALVRAEMRMMLGSLHSILKAIPAGDTAAIRQAAQASGLAGAADPVLERLLPEPFLAMGTATHRQFDSLAAAVAGGLPTDSVPGQLGVILASCVSCHDTYRLVATQ